MTETALNNGERQVAPTIDGIRRDHVARYEFAAKIIGSGSRVLDFACGIGYGSNLLANNDCTVLGLDQSGEAINYGLAHYANESVSLEQRGAVMLNALSDDFHAAVCFETIEHLEDPLPALKDLHRIAPLLIASVPNEDVFPHGGRIKFHFRHYTPDQFRELLESAGYEITGWYGQEGPESDVEPNINGRTLVVTAQRVTGRRKPKSVPFTAAPPKLRRVTILGLGPSLEMYVDHVKRLGGRKAFSDEVWGINALGDVIQCDRVFHMDDVRVQEKRAAASPNSNIAAMVKWLKTHPGPIYTSQKVDGYPGLVEFPLEDVINSTGHAYFNSTAAYAVAYAVHLGVEEINIFGADFTYANAHHAERGRACVEFWLGMAAARGIRIGMPENTSLMDTMEGHDAHFYGYDAVKVGLEEGDGKTVVTFEQRDLPSAEEVERNYDHSRHPNPHVSGEIEKNSAHDGSTNSKA